MVFRSQLSAVNRSALSILVVADDPDLRETLARHLRSRGCRVATAADCLEGLKAILLSRFDAVVSSVVMLSDGGLWLWREATTLRPELLGRFILCGASPLPDSFGGPVRSERFLSQPLDLSILWAEIRGVTELGQVEPS